MMDRVVPVQVVHMNSRKRKKTERDMDDLTERILEAADDHKSVPEIADICECGTARVYKVLNEHRPNRERRRRRTSSMRETIIGFLNANYHPLRVATLCGVSRQYVHQIKDQIAGTYSG